MTPSLPRKRAMPSVSSHLGRSSCLGSALALAFLAEVYAVRQSEVVGERAVALEEIATSLVDRTLWNIFDEDGGPKLQNITQGNLGDCYFLSGLAAVAHTHPELIKNMFVGTGVMNSLGRSVYRLRFLVDGKEKIVAVDDMVPMKRKADVERKFFFANFHAGDNAWPALLEKGFAKISGSYLGISNGQQHEAFQAITEAAIDHIYQKDPEWVDDKVWSFIKEAEDNKWPLGCGTTNRDHKLGVANGHAFAVMGTGIQEGEKAIQVFNPWGIKNLYSGKLKHLTSDSQGHFWILLKEFMSVFYSLTRAKVLPNPHSTSVSVPIGTASASFSVETDELFYVVLQWPSRRTLPRGCKYTYAKTNLVLRVAPDSKPEEGKTAYFKGAWHNGNLQVAMKGAGKYNVLAVSHFDEMESIKDVVIQIYSQEEIKDLTFESGVTATEAAAKVFGTCASMAWEKKQYKASTQTFRGSPLWEGADGSIMWVRDQTGLSVSSSKDKYTSTFADPQLRCASGASLIQQDSSEKAHVSASDGAENTVFSKVFTEEESDAGPTEEACLPTEIQKKLQRNANLDNFDEMMAGKEDSLFPPTMASIGEAGLDCGDVATGVKSDCAKLNNWKGITETFGKPDYVPPAPAAAGM
mmetsp:Transcript_82525/g.181371  ORF Transcript_82525/g.181371 Transcript_82525/m.181371 type:complete len:636 (+) Transcript_82525:81-1988(+)